MKEIKEEKQKNNNNNYIPFYKIYVYGEDNDDVEEILVNPKVNCTLGGQDGIYSLISSKFNYQYTPMKHTMKIKFGNNWYTINDINIYNFCVSGNLSSGENILIKILQNNVIDENKKNDYDEYYNKDEEILKANNVSYTPIPSEKNIPCSLCRQNSEYSYKRLLKLFGPFKYKNRSYYAHFLCIIYIPEIEILEENNKFKNPGKIINDYVNFKCAFCGEKGATLCCCYNNTTNYSNPLNIKCKNRFHYLCAIKSGCVISIVTYNVLCPKHIKYGFPQKIENVQNEEIIDINKKEEEKMIIDENENVDEKKEEQINIGEENNINDKNKKKICFYCNLIINEDESIQCEKCKNFFHESCVGLSHNNNENEYNDNDNDIDENKFICPDCLSKK